MSPTSLATVAAPSVLLLSCLSSLSSAIFPHAAPCAVEHTGEGDGPLHLLILASMTTRLIWS